MNAVGAEPLTFVLDDFHQPGLRRHPLPLTLGAAASQASAQP
jgi:hypothetical protein